MDRQKIILWIALLGLGTAGLTFGAAAFSFIESQKTELRRLEDQNQAFQQQLTMQREETERLLRRQEEMEARRREAEQQTFFQNSVCEQHYAVLRRNEELFAELSATHGTLIRSMNSCMRTRDAGAGMTCAMLVCTFGGDQCINAAVRGDQIKSTIQRTQSAARADNCPIPSSATLTFYSR